jgi:RecB family exonuclease
LRDQSVCPFRAFAVHRLAIEKKDAPSLLPRADERGTTLHAALHLAYRMLRSRETLEALGHEARRNLAERVVSDALADATQRNAPASYLATERARLVASVLDWFRVDLARPDFECETTEQNLEAQIAGVPFGIRIDRVDRDTSTDGRILIDYKSGTASPLQWRGVRLEEPQVPLYAVVLGGVREAALAEVAPLGSRLNGVAADPDRYERGPAIRMAAPTRLDAPTWTDLEERWRTSITSLARELASGVARVDPLHTGICRACHLRTLCRIDDRDTRFNDGD